MSLDLAASRSYRQPRRLSRRSVSQVKVVGHGGNRRKGLAMRVSLMKMVLASCLVALAADGALVAMTGTPAVAATTPEVISSYPSNAAGYDSDSTVSSISAGVTVPTVHCSTNPSGKTAGQFAGVELFSRTPVAANATVDVRTYCVGTTPHYSAEFVVNNVSGRNRVFSPAGVAVKPGNVLLFSLKANSSGQTLGVTNESTHKSATTSGREFTAAYGFSVGTGEVSANASGGVLTTGTVGDSYSAAIAGPVPSTSLYFFSVLVDGASLSGAPGLYSQYWTPTGTSGSHKVATPSGLSGGHFSITF